MQPDLLLAATTGLLGGFGHCAAMCGPLVASVTLVAAPGVGPRRTVAGQLLYHAGRITTYGCVGALMGLSGSFVNVAGRLAGLQNAVALLAGGFMILIGLGATGLLPGVGRAERRIAARVVPATAALLEGGRAGRLYAVGLVLGLLPCGLSYSAFVGAAATGGLPHGLLFALVFGLSTLPALLAIGGASALLSPRVRGVLYRAGGIAVAIVGAIFVVRGLGLHAAL